MEGSKKTAEELMTEAKELLGQVRAAIRLINMESEGGRYIRDILPKLDDEEAALDAVIKNPSERWQLSSKIDSAKTLLQDLKPDLDELTKKTKKRTLKRIQSQDMSDYKNTLFRNVVKPKQPKSASAPTTPQAKKKPGGISK